MTNAGPAGTRAYSDCSAITATASLTDGTAVQLVERGVEECAGWALVRVASDEHWLRLRHIDDPTVRAWPGALDATWDDLAATLDPASRTCVLESLHSGEIEATKVYRLFAERQPWATRFFACLPDQVAVAVGLRGVHADAARYDLALASTADTCWLPYLAEVVARDRFALLDQAGTTDEVAALTVDALLDCTPEIPTAAFAASAGIAAGTPEMQCIIDSPDEIREALTATDQVAAGLLTVELIYRCAPDVIVAQVVATLAAQNRAPSPAGEDCLRETDAALALLRSVATNEPSAVQAAQQLIETCLAQ